MKAAYPIIVTPADEGGYVVYVPDLQINTEGETLAECMYMARDAISLIGVDLEEDGKPIPEPSKELPDHRENEIVTFVDVDFDAYRRAQDTRSVRKNVTIPGYLNDLAEKAGVNFSQILQDGLKARLGVQ